jgi:hypothetical protein
MTTATQVMGVVVMIAVVFARTLLEMDPAMTALAAALVITVGGGTMAFLRSRTTRA